MVYVEPIIYVYFNFSIEIFVPSIYNRIELIKKCIIKEIIMDYETKLHEAYQKLKDAENLIRGIELQGSGGVYYKSRALEYATMASSNITSLIGQLSVKDYVDQHEKFTENNYQVN